MYAAYLRESQNKEMLETPHGFTVYCISFPNGKRYVGQTKKTAEERLKEHLRGACGPYMRHAVNKYRFMGIEVLQYCFDRESADYWERYYIGKLGTLGEGGYNLNSGGHKNATVSEQVKEKISDSLSHRLKVDEVFRERRKKQLRTASRKIMTPILHVESGQVFESQRAACRFFGIPVTHMTRLLRGMHKCLKGTFRYA